MERLHLFKKIDVVGKFGGAVGTYASHGKNGFEIERLVMESLGLEANVISTQIVHRDRHAEVIGFNAILASTISKIAKEIRNLQRNEIAEMFESFSKDQVGSSTMASKRNPHKSERLCGIQRILLGHVASIIEDNALDEHERVLVNSSVERVIFPESFNLLDFALTQLISILKGLDINEANIKRNLEVSKGAIMSEYLMMLMVEFGHNRQDAHEFLRQVAVLARDKDISYKEAILLFQSTTGVDKFKMVFSPESLDEYLDPSKYTGLSAEIVDRVIDKYKDVVK